MKARTYVLATFLLASAACAREPVVAIDHAWARATPPGSTVAAVYADVLAAQADEIVAVSTPSAQRIEMHASTQEQGVMKMRRVERVSLPAQQRVRFESGGLHLMLLGLRAPLVAGKSISLTFQFQTAAPVTITAKVVAPDSDPHAH